MVDDTFDMIKKYELMVGSSQSGILVAFWYHVTELETDHATINVDNFDSLLWLSVNKLDWWTIWLTLLLSGYNYFSIVRVEILKSDCRTWDKILDKT